MPDIVDRAQVNEELLRREAMHRRQYAREIEQEERPLYIDGIRCCLDCENPIPEARLRVKPGALRCVRCQGIKERRG